MTENKLKIPGLINEKNPKLSQAEIQAQRDEFSKQQALHNNSIPNSMTMEYELTLEQVKTMFPNADVSRIAKHGNQSHVSDYVDLNSYGTGQPYWGIDTGQDWMKQLPYQQPLELDDYRKKFFDPNIHKKYGPSPSRQGDIGKQDWEKELMNYMKPKKSAFEEILDLLFTSAEKEQFLIDVGYYFENDPMNNGATIKRKLATGEIKTITMSLDELFLKEITVKFKGLLLAKGTLRIKFPEVKTNETA